MSRRTSSVQKDRVTVAVVGGVIEGNDGVWGETQASGKVLDVQEEPFWVKLSRKWVFFPSFLGGD